MLKSKPKSYSSAPDPTLSPPAMVEVAVVLVAWIFSATTSPTTESLAYGDDVPIPILPLALTTVSGVPPTFLHY